MELILGSNKKINGSWTGYDTNRLLERISNCQFFEGKPVWTNVEIFNRLNKCTSPTRRLK
ncbi:unnamed protein product [Onchocerca flexuosa]|uniref:Uncharacterized protein n=1 Tax=Onchocerca flexuosa TaxID=387005 RepID=A0A183HX71_9BILA|nr:unnamed protein product [Onchocerca flexuosa]